MTRIAEGLREAAATLDEVSETLEGAAAEALTAFDLAPGMDPDDQTTAWTILRPLLREMGDLAARARLAAKDCDLAAARLDSRSTDRRPSRMEAAS
ncbi:MAG: hypothetical protein MH204_10255 [Fimbriimonadaceae bacterium]|nr:hypothetical protein [Fimbriimonadaceae bacterium]